MKITLPAENRQPGQGLSPQSGEQGEGVRGDAPRSYHQRRQGRAHRGAAIEQIKSGQGGIVRRGPFGRVS